LKEREVLAVAFGPGMLRLVTHLDTDDEAIDRVAGILRTLHP
jgi:threonine aldolase